MEGAKSVYEREERELAVKSAKRSLMITTAITQRHNGIHFVKRHAQLQGVIIILSIYRK